MSEQLGFDACGLCGITSAEVHRRLVEWTEPVEGRLWSYVPRCDDRPACRARVELLGEPWPVNDRTPAPEPEAESTPLEVAPAPPMAPTEAPAADAKEEIAWLS